MEDQPAAGARPTIRDVAARAGVSKSLVSLVLTGSPRVSPVRRRAVEEAITALDYRPSAAARSLTRGRTRAVGVLVNDLRNPWFVEVVEAVNAALHERSTTMLLGDARLDRSADERVLATFVDLRLDGLVLVGSMDPSPAVLEAARRLPAVVAGAADVDLEGVDTSVQDDAAGGRIATEHLLALGHRRVVHVAGSEGAVMRVRAGGYAAAMAGAGLAREARVVVADMHEDGGYRASLELLGERPRPTALFVATDVAAVGALRAAAQLGLRVPQDVSVVGFDDTRLAALPGTGLTSVDAASAEVGRTAVELLLARIGAPGRPRRTVVAPVGLAVRTTSGPPPG